MDDFQASMMEIFAMETNKFLEDLERILMENESQKRGITAYVPQIFRIMHTIKSSSAMMGFDNISKIAHATEDVFHFIRENKPETVDEAKLTDITLDAIDFIKRAMSGEDAGDQAEKIAGIKGFLEQMKNPPVQAVPTEAPAPSPSAAAAPVSDPGCIVLTVLFKKDTQMLGIRAFEVENNVKRAVKALTATPNTMAADAEEIIKASGFVLEIQADQSVEELQAIVLKSPFVESVAPKPQAPQSSQPPLPTQPQAGAKQPDPQQPAEAPSDPQHPPKFGEAGFVERRTERRQPDGQYVNVAISKLDTFVDLAGETIVSEMLLTRALENQDKAQSDINLANLRKLIIRLQEAALSTRMVPVRDTFHKLNRLIRDMCRKLNKDVQFITEGEETEIDRTLIDNLYSPLMHIARNSVDHGIESEEVRAALGKDPKGTVRLSATTEGRDVLITITDDGKGFDKEKIIAKAIKMELVTREGLAKMTDEEIYALVFQPGFSTNTEVTEFSGRGVGMDVVNENMKKMNGKITVSSQKDVGSKTVLRIPLTLALIDALVVKVGDENCAIPVNMVSEVIRSVDSSAIRVVNGQEVVLIGEKTYRILNLFNFYGTPEPSGKRGGVWMTARNEANRFALFAEEITDRMNIVVKPVPKIFKGIKGISGCTILGDGKVSMILDVAELYQHSKS